MKDIEMLVFLHYPIIIQVSKHLQLLILLYYVFCKIVYAKRSE